MDRFSRFFSIKPSFRSSYFRQANPNVYLMDSTSPLRQYRSPASYRDNRQGLGGTSRGTWEKRAVAGRRSSRKWPRHRNDGGRRRRGGKRINARRYTEEGNPGNAFANQSSSPGARISSKEPFVFPSRLPIPRFLPIPFYLFFLICLLCVCLVLLHASTRAPTLPLPTPEVVQSHRRRRVASSGRRNDGEKEERQEGNAVTRENPLRNVFGACTTRCYLQCRACKIYV